MIQGQAGQGCAKFMVRVTRVAPPWMVNVLDARAFFFLRSRGSVYVRMCVVFALRNIHPPDLLEAGDRGYSYQWFAQGSSHQAKARGVPTPVPAPQVDQLTD